MSTKEKQMSEEYSEPQENQATQVAVEPEQKAEVGHDNHDQGHQEESEKMVPLTAVQKERKKRQQLQFELEELKKKQQPAEEDYSKYESVTREELGNVQKETIRTVRETDYAERYPERAEFVQNELEDFLTRRPNLAYAIQNSENRIKEAYELMQALNSKKSQAKSQAQQAQAPRSSNSIPKAAALNDAVDVFNMSDSEFRDWRKSKRRRR